jgi:hypothetical protein
MATSGVINLVDRVAGENAIKRSVHRNLAGEGRCVSDAHSNSQICVRTTSTYQPLRLPLADKRSVKSFTRRLWVIAVGDFVRFYLVTVG